MYQCNLIIVKSSNSVALLKENGYSAPACDVSPDGWSACHCYERWYKYSMVGSRSLALKEEGKYPYELSASDYTRAIQKETNFLEQQLSMIKEDTFWEKKKQFNTYQKRRAGLLREIRQQEEKNELSKAEIAMLDAKEEELILLDRKIQEFTEDRVFVHACMHADGGYKWARIQIREKQREINSSSYNMHEFHYYRKLFLKVLRYDPFIYFTYQNEDGRKDFTLVKTISIDDLQIGDLAMLCSYDVLKICRKK